MKEINFITTENGDDIIISLCSQGTNPLDVSSFIMMRTPKFEPLLEPHKRGICLSWEDEDDIVVIADRININRNEIHIKTRNKIESHKFNIKQISDEDYKSLLKQLEIINFDKSAIIIKD